MFNGQLSLMAVHVEKELEYYKKLALEQKEIIEQLTGTGQPKGYVYMHPADVADAMNAMSVSDMWIYRGGTKFESPDYEIIQLNGRRIRQSPHIPATSKNFV